MSETRKVVRIESALVSWRAAGTFLPIIEAHLQAGRTERAMAVSEREAVRL